MTEPDDACAVDPAPELGPVRAAYDAWREVMRVLAPLDPVTQKRVLLATMHLLGLAD